MRFRAGLIFFFFALWLGVGCRKPLAPTVDSNFPPETWITAAPQDTITTRDENGAPSNQPGTIPFRYHLYWSGSDQDGAVSGFYWAVVETVGSVSGLPLPPLPGPKPQDYRYTSVRDSVFIFNVHEGTNNRQHAFYIYAVDNKGKPDATPARVIFNTLDRFPPIPIIDLESRATGLILHPNEAWDGVRPFPVPTETTIALRDTFSRLSQPSDIVPVNSKVYMRWHSEITVADNPAVFYKYKIGEGNEVEFVTVPASVTGTEYNTTDHNRLGPGLKIFTLRAIDRAGGARTDPETTRRFYMNLLPDTWFAGPDPTQSIYTTEFYLDRTTVKKRYFQVGTGLTPQTRWTTALPGSYLHPDSVRTMPALRIPRKTFFEIYTEYNTATPVPRHRIYVRGEGDTVHMNSWVLLHGGGFDADSPYSLRLLNPSTPGLGTTPVLTSTPLEKNGSPIGFRFHIPVCIRNDSPCNSFLDPGVLQSTLSPVFPLTDPSIAPEVRIGGYTGMQQSGRAYAILRSEDGSRGLDNRIQDPIAFVDSVENRPSSMHPARYALKDKVLTFYVNRAPYLTQTEDPTNGFQPYEGQPFFERRIRLTLDKVADDDPYNRFQRSPGGAPPNTPTSPLYRFSVLLRSRRTGSNRVASYAPVNLTRKVGANQDQLLDIPDSLAGPEVTVEIEVCDCERCEEIPGQGRCRRYPPIHITVPPVTATKPSASPSSENVSSTGPGSSGKSSRSRTP